MPKVSLWLMIIVTPEFSTPPPLLPNMAKSNLKTSTINLDGKEIIIETGRFAPQASGAVTVRCGDTIVFAGVVSGAAKEGQDFFPLTVEYREKHYAGGIISSSRFIKREGRPSDEEILTSRLIDRSIRPLFPENYFDEVQLIVHPLSIDGENEPEILGLIAASAALSLSDLPWAGPIGAVRVGLDQEGKFLANPTNEQKQTSSLDLVVSGGVNGIAMVEAGANEVSEDQVLSALNFGQEKATLIIKALEAFAKDAGKTKKVLPEVTIDPGLEKLSSSLNIPKILQDSRDSGKEGVDLNAIVTELVGDNEDINRLQLSLLVDSKIKQFIRKQILEDSVRYDGRKTDEIRAINAEVGLLPRTHGSGFFKRGLTHVLSVVTLGSPGAEQLIEGMKGGETKRYMHHYNMAPFASGEPKRFGTPGRREIGHGALAERALIPVLPAEADFAYTIRVVSEVMSSNGSTSQASVCGSTIALMDAGVPIKKPVAGIAMGLITAGDKFVTLSDIAGLEDHFGDMDFKVAGTKDGITAIQMDVKVSGVTAKALGQALEQAKIGRLHILDKMLEAIKEPRPNLSTYAPRIVTLQIDPEKIGTVIGPGGKTIRPIQEEFSVEINLDDNGLVSITGTDSAKVEAAKKQIEALTAEAEVGKVYTGKVVRIQPFGAFVEILPGKDGLVHVSNMSKEFVSDPNEIVKEGDTVEVKVFEVDSQGRINLTMNLEDNPTSRNRSERPDRGGDRGDRRPSFGGGNRGPRRDGDRSSGGAPRFSRFTDKR